jgi:hypothetical protein
MAEFVASKEGARDPETLSRKMTLLEVIGLMQNQADAFQISRDELHLPEKDIEGYI